MLKLLNASIEIINLNKFLDPFHSLTQGKFEIHVRGNPSIGVTFLGANVIVTLQQSESIGLFIFFNGYGLSGHLKKLC